MLIRTSFYRACHATTAMLSTALITSLAIGVTLRYRSHTFSTPGSCNRVVPKREFCATRAARKIQSAWRRHRLVAREKNTLRLDSQQMTFKRQLEIWVGQNPSLGHDYINWD
ncbi:hypothetical protein ACHHYP_01306 [Achlya hypogyna]|uniref:Uncharacterized protein n=1 Tax=Achlya hypogyna TaxID=1202772 RepID=A0A1V9Z935_ACHHY|nr:hypothetical protein ACHHYP_01306 [Achlya hypogyna]